MEYLRIKKNTDFQKIFAKGKRGFANKLTVLYFPSKELKMGICVGKKHGNSVTRNRVKRLMREIFRKNIPMVKREYNYVLIPKAAEEYDYKTLEQNFLYILKKQDLLLNLQKKAEEKEERE